MNQTPELQEIEAETSFDCQIIARPADLLKSLQLVLPIVPKSSLINPVLTNFLLEIDNKYLKVTGYDNKNTIIAEQELTHLEGKAKICIQAHLLCNILKALDSSEDITINFRDKLLTIIATCGTYNLIQQDEKEYPKIKKSLSVYNNVLNSDFIAKIIKIRYACSPDHLRPAYNGVFFNFTDKYADAVALDGHTAHLIRRTNITGASIQALIPGKSLSSLEPLITGEDFIKVNIMKNHMAFSVTSTQFIATQIQEKFPDYDKVMDTSEHLNSVIIIRKVFIACLERIALMEPIEGYVSVRIGDSNIVLKAESYLGDVQETIVLPTKLSASFELTFTLKRLLSSLNHLDTLEVELLYKQPAAPVFFLPYPQQEHEIEKILLVPVYNNPKPDDFKG